MFFKLLFKKIIFREKNDSKSYIDYLRKKGVTIGNDCIIYSPTKTFIDIQYPWMITIGNHVKITEGVKILTHDYSWSVLKRFSFHENPAGAIFGASGEVVIGNNVFIGMNSIILRNVHIGNNVIIGAGSIVSRDCVDNGVYVGNPAKYVMSIEEFFQKRRARQLDEALLLAYRYWKKYQKAPEEEVFHEYFMLFASIDNVLNKKEFLDKVNLCENGVESIEYIKSHSPIFNGYDEFWAYCKNYYGIEEKRH